MIMKKFTKILALVLALALTAAVSVSLTLAYLTDKDEKVNVMTLGNVDIELHEYERVTDADGNWITSTEADKYGYYPDELQAYTQAKPLYPAVFADGNIKWDDRNGNQNASGAGSHQQSWAQVGASGSNQLFDDSVKNAQDKFVFVENTGKSDAYVRTWIALEQGAVAAGDFNNIIMTNSNADHWSWEVADTDVVIGDSEYYILCATYLGPKSNPTGILAPDTVSYPSLLQVYMKPEATNADVKDIDGNGNGTYDILVFSQAVQTAGFDNAEAALTAGFGNAHPWTTNAPSIPVVVDSAEALTEALVAGKDVVLGDDVTVDADATMTVAAGKDVTLDLAGHTLTATSDQTGANINIFDVRGEMTVTGGTIDYTHTGADMGWNASINVFNVTAGGVLNIENATVINNGGSSMAFAVHLNNWGEVTLNVNNSTIKSSYIPVRVFNSGYDMNNVTIQNSNLHGKKYVLWVHNYIGDLDPTKHSDEAINARLNLDIYNNNTFTSDETAKGIVLYGFDSYVYYDANGNLVP